MSINRDLRESLLGRIEKRRFRVHMLNESQQKLRKSIENNLQLKKHTKTILKETQKCCPKVRCSRKCTSDFLNEVFPFVRIMKRYSVRENLLADVVAGLTVGIMHIPQGMAYGFLSQLPPIYGLYTSFFPVLLYFFFGSSKHVSIGTFAVVSLMVGQVVNRGYQTHVGRHILSMNDSTVALPSNLTDPIITPVIEPPIVYSGHANPVKLGYALSVTFVVGVLQLVLGAMRLGFMASFMSDPFISGFTTGAAVHVFSSQIKHVFGVRVHNYHGALALVYFYAEFFLNIKSTNMVTFTASATCILVLILIKEGINNNNNCKPHLLLPVPIELIVIAVSTILSYYTKLETKYEVTVVGNIPSGLPIPDISNFRYIPDVIGDGLTIGFIAYAISFSMAKILADRHGYRVNANQELVALGVCNFVSSFFQSYCCAASLSRSLVQDAAGGKTQVVGLVSSMIVLVVLLYVGPLFESLPECILACIVIVTLKGMFLQFGELKRLWRLSKKDFSVWIVTFIAVVVLDVALGLLIGIVFSLYFVLRHSQKPQMSQLGQLPGTSAYQDMKATKKVKDVDGMKIFRFESSIYFANAEHFRDRLYAKTGLVPRKLLRKKRKAMHLTLQRRKQELEEAELERKKERMRKHRYSIEIVTPKQVDPHEEHLKQVAESRLILDRFDKAWSPPVKVIIIDLSVVNYVDTVAITTLSKIVTDYKEVGIKIFLAGCKPDIRTLLRKADFNKRVDYNCLYFTVHEAVVIGREVLETESKKNAPDPENVKLFQNISEGDPNKERKNEEDIDDEEDDEDEEGDRTNVIVAQENEDGDESDFSSDETLNSSNNEDDADDEEWFDTHNNDIEMTVLSQSTGFLCQGEIRHEPGDLETPVSVHNVENDDQFDNISLAENE